MYRSYKETNLSHDPHPTHEGLKEIEYYWALKEIK
jgi:hypothetical protein